MAVSRFLSSDSYSFALKRWTTGKAIIKSKTFFSWGVLRYFRRANNSSQCLLLRLPRPQHVDTSSNSTRHTCHLDGQIYKQYPGQALLDLGEQMGLTNVARRRSQRPFSFSSPDISSSCHLLSWAWRGGGCQPWHWSERKLACNKNCYVLHQAPLNPDLGVHNYTHCRLGGGRMHNITK
jgi:hypothetical protein